MTEKSDSPGIKDEIGKIVNPVFNAVAQEQPSGQTLVGRSVSFSSFNPHNYRQYWDYQKDEKRLVSGLARDRFISLGSQNKGTELIYQHKESGWKITIKKTQLEVKKKHIERDWHLIDNAAPEEADKVIDIKREEGKAVFKAFVEDFGGRTTYTLLNEYFIDNAVKNSLTKKLPVKSAWEDEVSKKLYMEDKIEMKKVLYAKNLMHNAGLYDFSPEISQRLDMLSQSFTAIDLFTKQINLHLTAIQELRDAVKDLRQGTGVGELATSKKSPLFNNGSPSSPQSHEVRRIPVRHFSVEELERGVIWENGIARVLD